MAFSVPTFNLVCNVFTGPFLAKVLRIANLPCNLAVGRRTNAYQPAFQTDTGGASSPMLLVPARSDLRDNGCVGGYDVVEVPAGTGRFYALVQVDDMARGFPNEYRIATMGKCVLNNDPVDFAGTFWPTPIP
jgi:hypothetical protein